MGLWIDTAHQEVISTESAAGRPAVCTLQTEEQFYAIMVDCPPDGGRAEEIAGRLAARLASRPALEEIVAALQEILRPGEHAPLTVLQVLGGVQARLVEVDAPPLFLVRRGRPALLPVVEDDLQGRLVRQCEFALHEGDHLAIVSAGYIRTKGWDRRWGWRDVALSVKRLSDTGGDAGQLLGALVRMVHRLAQGEPVPAATVVAMHVRPLRTATIWSGPPADPADDARAVERLLAAPGKRVICGDTTAAIAARVLGQTLTQEPRPAEGWGEVPPTWRLPGVDLVTEGVVTLRRTRERLAEAQEARDLPRASDGATRLARLLLEADVICLLLGSAVNPAQREGAHSWREEAIARLVDALRARGKVVSVEQVDNTA